MISPLFITSIIGKNPVFTRRVAGLARGMVSALLCLGGVGAHGQALGTDTYVPGGRPGIVTTLAPTKTGSAAKVLAAPTVYARTSQILLNSYGDTQLAVPLAANATVDSYSVSVLPPAASGVLKLNGTAITTATLITPANAGNLTFDPAAGYFGTAVFQYTAKVGSQASAAVTYGIPVTKAACGGGMGQANNLAYYARTEGEDWKVTRSVTVGGVTVTANPTGTPYASAPSTTDILFVSDQASQPGKGLVWAEDYTSTAAVTASMTFTFSRPLANFTLSAGDIDNGVGYTDQLTLQGYDASNNLVAIPAGNVATGFTNSYSNNVFTGTANSPANAATNVLVTFPTAIVRLVLTYRNTATTQADPTSQLIVFPSMAWCAQADIQTTLSGPTRAQAGGTVTYTATTLNGGTDQVNTLNPTVQLATGLSNVTGGAYNSSTGVLTLATISNLASGASVVNTITYTMPASVAVTATSSFVSTADDPTSGNNTSTLTTAQNRAPVASDVTSAPAILSSTTGQTNIAPFNASDPDASTGNTTIVSYTILSLPTPAQGTLYVNGTAATAGQVISVPASATPASPGYQLSFVPNGTFSGSASFTYKATDDVGVASNTANYFVPVTPGADLVSTASGSGTAVEGQTKTFGVTTVNNGPASSTNVVATLTLSSKPAFSAVTVTNGSYDPTTGIVTFNPIASLASGASVLNNVTVQLTATPATFTVTAANTAATADPAPANNNGTAPAAQLTVTVTPVGPTGIASDCATPGSDSPTATTTLTTNPNAYYPAGATTQTLNAGTSSWTVGTATGAATPIAAGDLLMVIQMQGADINATNTDAYGDGVAGGFATGNLTNASFTAGTYEYVKATNAVPATGGTLTITSGLKNSYQNANASATAGQRRFQVVRIPQYKNLTVGATIVPSAWDGSTGGILALDVAGKLQFTSGATLDASGKGFRGGAGQKLTGTTGLSGTDYRAAAPASASTTTGAHAMKGEGLVGTPRYVNMGTALVDTGVDGYPSGSAGRGGAGNAGGGGTDANPTNNTQNSGGGGGGNGSRGGRGGNAASSNAAVGGEPAAPFSAPSSSRLVLGGGGGAGVSGNGSGGGPNPGFASSGAPGGGIVLVRAGSIDGLTGTVRANGAAASSAPVQDGSGGGGGGGSILITVNNAASLAKLTLAANGGVGGSNGASSSYGPGGGGGGGIILTNAAPGSASVTGGASGTTSGGSAYGAGPGLAGLANGQISNSIANSTAGINCSVDVTATVTAPASAASGQTVNVSVVFANNGGQDAVAVTRTVTLSAGSATTPVTNVSAPGSTNISGPDATTGDVTITYQSTASLAAGSTASFGISYTAPGTLGTTATAVITTNSGEPVTDNNTSAVTTTITGYADVVSALFGLNASITGRPTSMYSVVFANNGPAAASNVGRTVTLPPGATLSSSQLSDLTALGATYNSGTQVINFGTVATLNSRAAQVFSFSFTAPNTSGSMNVVSNITTGSQQDGANGGGTAPDMFTFAVTNNPASDLATDGVSTSATAVMPGQTASFTLRYTNFGPSAATGSLRYGQLTPGLSNVVVTDYDGTVLTGAYNATTGVLTLPNVNVANGGTAYVTVAFAAPATGPVNASGSMSGGTGSISSGIYGNNQATASIAVTPVADVATSISGSTQAVSGNLVTFTVLTANNGPSPAAAVAQTVQLPTGLSGIFASGNGTYNSSNGVVTFPALAVLASGATVSNTVSLAMPASFTASAAVSTATTEISGTTANNTATAAPTTVLAATSDLANVYNTFTFSDKNVAPGTPVTFTVLTGNNGPNPALGVAQQLILPTGLATVSISGGGIYNSATGVVTFPALASLASGASATNTVIITAPAAGPVGATAFVSSTTSDPVPADNAFTRFVDVTNAADLTTTIVGPGIASATQVATFAVNSSNKGPIPATNVVQTVVIPASLASSDVTVTGGGAYDPATGLITWPTVGTLAVGESLSYGYSYVAPAYKSTDAANPRTIVSQATVTSSTPDGVPANNTAALATIIRWNSDVSIAVAGPASAVVGNSITFTVSTTNNGPAPAASVTPTVRIATSLSSVVASGGGVYDISTGIITFPTITNQAVGVTGIVTNTITIVVPDRPIIGVSAAANVPATSNDTNLTDNAATLILPVTPQTTTLVDLQTTIAANLTTQQAGQPIVLTITATNRGGSTVASNLTEQVSLPAGLSGVVANGPGGTTGTYDPASGVVTFPAASNVAPGTTLTYTVTVNRPGNDPLVATASINGNYSDPTPGNNSQVVSVNIIPVADVATRLSGPVSALPGAVVTYEVLTVDNGPSPASAVVQTVQLPTGLTGVTLSGGGTYDAASGRVTFPTIGTQAVGMAGAVTNTITFIYPTTASTLVASLSSGTTENTGTLADNTSTLAVALANQAPLANTLANRLQTPEGNTAGPLTLTALTGLDADGSLASFTIAGVPAAAAGVLALNGTPVTAGQVISNSNAANLTFDPAASFVGDAFFTYTATDNQGAVSAPALFTIAVGQDNASVYTSTPLKGGANQYQDGDVIANAFDANGGAYNAAAAVVDNGLRTARAGALPAGLEIDPTTGQVRVFNRSLLVAGSYPVSITTIDANGGVTTQNVNLVIGSSPLPVELTRFDAVAVGADTRLSWSTAQELDNTGFQVERSLDGSRFEALGFVRGAGTSIQVHNYAFVDAGVGRQHSGPVYYRLQQRDGSGRTTYSPVRTVTFVAAAQVTQAVTLYPNPNPTTTTTTLDLTDLVGPSQVTLLDLAGRVLLTRTLAGGQAHLLPLDGLPNGSYLVLVRNGSLSFVERLLKQ
jgi:uncharacterized repeat protein (TIGR01451 family)